MRSRERCDRGIEQVSGRFLVVAAAAALLTAASVPVQTAWAQSVEINPALAKVIAAAKQEGKIVLRNAPTVMGGPDGARIAQAGIKAEFGIDIPVEWSPAAAFGPLGAQLLQEYQAGTPSSTDVYYATPPQIVPLMDKGLFQPVDWAALMPERILPAMVEADKHALRVSVALPGILYNVKNAAWVKDIHTTADLLKPEYKGKYVTTPFLGGFDVLLADDVWGVAKTRDFVTQFAQQIAGLLPCGGQDRIASGEFQALVIDCAGTWQNTLKFRGKGVIDNQIVNDMAQRRYAYLTILKNAPHPNAGILFTLYMVSHDGQENVMWDYFGQDVDTLPDSHMHQAVAALNAKDVKTIDVTMDWWRGHSDIDKANQELAKLVAGH
jgi:ABC-type Fe3+ transport system substrate-binding protein